MVLALVRPSGIVRNFVEATDVLNVKDMDTTGGTAMSIGGVNALTITIGRTGQTVEFPGTVHLLDSSVLTGDGDVTLGDGDGDVITFGGAFVTAVDVVNLGTANVGGDTIVNLRVDMAVADTKDLRFSRVTGTGVMVLPSTSVGEAGAIRTTAGGAFEWWNGAAWVAAGAAAGNTLQQSYDAGTGTITLDASGPFIVNLDNASAGNDFVVASSAGGADSLTLTSTGANAMSLQADVTSFAASASTTMDLDAAGALSINSSGGVINIGDDAVAQNIYVGTGAAARTITLGILANSTEIELNAIRLDLNAGANGIQIDAAGNSNITTSAGILTITAAAGSTWSTAAGALTLTSAAAATWSTLAGALSLTGFTNLNLTATGGEVNFTDSYMAGGGYTAPMPLANNAGEYTAFVANFGDLTSLISAVNTAFSTGSGFVATVAAAGTTAGYALGGAAVDDQVANADATTATSSVAKCFGFAAANAAGGTSVQVKTSGRIAVTSPAVETWARGDMIYTSLTPGKLSKVAPLAVGNMVQCVGYAAATDAAPATAHSMWAHITIPTSI